MKKTFRLLVMMLVLGCLLGLAACAGEQEGGDESRIAAHITLDPNGGTVSQSSITLAKNEDGNFVVPTLPVPTFAGHEFLGWYEGNIWGEITGGLFEETVVVVSQEDRDYVANNPNGNVSLVRNVVAKWKLVDKTLATGLHEDDAITLQMGADAVDLTFYKDGSYYKGWYQFSITETTPVAVSLRTDGEEEIHAELLSENELQKGYAYRSGSSRYDESWLLAAGNYYLVAITNTSAAEGKIAIYIPQVEDMVLDEPKTVTLGKNQAFAWFALEIAEEMLAQLVTSESAIDGRLILEKSTHILLEANYRGGVLVAGKYYVQLYRREPLDETTTEVTLKTLTAPQLTLGTVQNCSVSKNSGSWYQFVLTEAGEVELTLTTKNGSEYRYLTATVYVAPDDANDTDGFVMETKDSVTKQLDAGTYYVHLKMGLYSSSESGTIKIAQG